MLILWYLGEREDSGTRETCQPMWRHPSLFQALPSFLCFYFGSKICFFSPVFEVKHLPNWPRYCRHWALEQPLAMPFPHPSGMSKFGLGCLLLLFCFSPPRTDFLWFFLLLLLGEDPSRAMPSWSTSLRTDVPVPTQGLLIHPGVCCWTMVVADAGRDQRGSGDRGKIILTHPM